MTNIKQQIIKEFLEKFVEPTIPGTPGATQAEHFRVFLLSALDRLEDTMRSSHRRKVRSAAHEAVAWAEHSRRLTDEAKSGGYYGRDLM